MSDTTEPTDSAPARSGRLSSLSQRASDNWQVLAGGAGVFLTALALYTRFSINGELGRDESIYAYGAQRFAHGVAPYASIFDPKTPGATLLGGFAAAFARLIGSNQLHMIRVAFLVVSILTAVAVYLLAHELFKSVPGAIAAGAAFTCFTKFSHDALIGPDAKTPGVLFFVLAMLFMVRKRWFAGAIFAGLAFIVWQPLFWFGLIAIVGAAIDAGQGNRLREALRALAGAAIPTAVLAVYFLVAGAFHDFFTAAFLYPLTGTQRAKESLKAHFLHPFHVINHYPLSATVFWIGTVALVAVVVVEFARRGARAALTAPLFLIVFVTFLLNILYALTDFQGDPDTLPFLPYPALGIGGAVAGVFPLLKQPTARRAATGVVLAGSLALAAIGWVSFSNAKDNNNDLLQQLRTACGVSRIVGKGTLVSLGNPAAFVLTNRVSRTNYIYLNAGVDTWKIHHTKGGLAGWEQQVIAGRPSVITVDGWSSRYEKAMIQFLSQSGYRKSFVGRWRVWLTPQAVAKARQVGVQLTQARQQLAQTTSGHKLPAKVPCGNG